MADDKIYKIIPKDKDPEVAIVLDYITDSAKRHFNYKQMEEDLNPVIDPDFFLFQILVAINTKRITQVLGETFNEVLMLGYIIEMEELQRIAKEIEDNCKMEPFVMGMAADLMFNQGRAPCDALINVMQLLQ